MLYCLHYADVRQIDDVIAFISLLGSMTKYLPMRGMSSPTTRQEIIDGQIKIDGILNEMGGGEGACNSFTALSLTTAFGCRENTTCAGACHPAAPRS